MELCEAILFRKAGLTGLVPRLPLVGVKFSHLPYLHHQIPRSDHDIAIGGFWRDAHCG